MSVERGHFKNFMPCGEDAAWPLLTQLWNQVAEELGSPVNEYSAYDEVSCLRMDGVFQ